MDGSVISRGLPIKIDLKVSVDGGVSIGSAFFKKRSASSAASAGCEDSEGSERWRAGDPSSSLPKESPVDVSIPIPTRAHRKGERLMPKAANQRNHPYQPPRVAIRAFFKQSVRLLRTR